MGNSAQPPIKPHRSGPGGAEAARADLRIPAIDIARGLSILLVVSVHTIIGVDAAIGQRSAAATLVDFAQAFRVPAFLFVAGLYLRRAMTLGWIDLFRKRLFGLLVLFILWSAILFAIRQHGLILANPAAALIGDAGMIKAIASGFLTPTGLLMFIYLLMICLIVARISMALPLWLVLGVALMLETARIRSGIPVIDEFSARFFYFYLGIALAPRLFPAFRGSREEGAPSGDKLPVSNLALAGFLGFWLVTHALMTGAGWDHWRGVSLLTGLAGIAALFAGGLILARLWPEGWPAKLLAVMGARSLVIVLVFTLPMIALRQFGLAFLPGASPVLLSLGIITLSLAISLLIDRGVQGTRLQRLFEPPVLGATGKDRA